MNKLAFAACAAAAIALSGCAAIDNLTGGTTGQTALQDAEKGLTAAHVAHDAAAVTLATAVNAGALKGANAATAQKYLDQSYQDLQLADAAVAVGDATTIQQETAAATALVELVAQITGAH